MISPQVIAAYPFLGQLSAGSRRLIATHGKMRVLRHGATVIRKGDRVGGMHFVIAGHLRIFTHSSGGEEASLYAVNAGESCLLATSALLADMLYPAWVEVDAREAKLYCIPSAVFRTLFDREPAVRNFTVQLLSARVFDLMAAVEALSLQSVEDRLRNLLVQRADPRGEVRLTHQKIAAEMGTAREVVTRKLRQLTQAGLVRVRRGHITLLRPAAPRSPRP